MSSSPAFRLLPLATLAAALAPSEPLAAQGRGGGLFDGMPMALSTRAGDPLPRVGGDILQKAPGIHATVPGTGHLGPRYGFLGTSEYTLFLDPLRQMVPLTGAAPDVDAFSLGLDWISANPDGTLYSDPNPGFWAAITFSVTRDTVGVGGPVAVEAAGPGGAASDVFSYFWPGSQVGGAQPIDEPFLSQDAREISLQNVPNPPLPVDVDAHDAYLHLYRMLGRFPGMQLPRPNVFFSVSDATKALIPDTWVGGAANAHLKSGATVFRMTVLEVPVGSGFYKWTEPAVFFQPADLGLGDDEDLDALAYDPQQSYVLMSTDHRVPGVVRRNPILFVNLLTDTVTPVPLTKPGTMEEISDEVGLGDSPLPDDVDSICALDPRGSRRQQFPDLLEMLIAAPRTPTSGPRSNLTAFHGEGPSVHFVTRDLPTNGPSGLLLSFQSSFVPLPGAVLLNPHLLLHIWQPLPPQFPQQLVIPFALNDPQVRGLPVFYQNFSFAQSIAGPFSSSVILDLYL
jgi:hypothetical protein